MFSKRALSSPHYILFSVLLTILIGAILLALPCSRHESIGMIDLFFTATSATCVTGLLTIPLASFTAFGKFVILALIHVGGIGLLTLTLFLLSFFTDLGIASRFMVGKVFDVDSAKKGKQIVTFIVSVMLLAELVGTACIYFSLYYGGQESLLHGLFYSFFHAASSFHNAGFTLFASGLRPFATNMPFIVTTGLLVFLGGFGFISLYELCLAVGKKKSKNLALSLQTRIILFITPCIIAITTAVFLLLEPHALAPDTSWFVFFVDAFFNALSCRNAGLTTFDILTLSNATLFFILIIAFIGSAPGSSGSGIKVTSFAVLLATVRSVTQGNLTVSIRGREIPKDQVFKVFCIISLSITWIASMLFLLLMLEKNTSFFALSFEIVSAFTTLGMSLGITAQLSALSKIILMASMFLGRVGSITLVLALARPSKPEFHYPEERLMIS
jgi:trk system potassium uptake protein TrkH